MDVTWAQQDLLFWLVGSWVWGITPLVFFISDSVSMIYIYICMCNISYYIKLYWVEFILIYLYIFRCLLCVYIQLYVYFSLKRTWSRCTQNRYPFSASFFPGKKMLPRQQSGSAKFLEDLPLRWEASENGVPGTSHLHWTMMSSEEVCLYSPGWFIGIPRPRNR